MIFWLILLFLADLIKVFVQKIGESESKSIISTYLLDRQFKLLEKPSRAKVKQNFAEPQRGGGIEADVGSDTEDDDKELERYEDDNSAIDELRPELIVPLDRKTGELLLEIEDLPLTFEAMKLKEELLIGLDEYGIEEPFPILQVSTDFLINKRDCLIRTIPGSEVDRIVLYCMSILQCIETSNNVPITCQAIILCPSGEVIEKVFDCITTMGAPLDVEVFGAVENFLSDDDKEILDAGVHVVIGTPKLMSLLCADKIINPDNLTFVVIDSAEEMSEAGYMEDIADTFHTIPEAKLKADEWDKAILEEGRRRIQTQLAILCTNVTAETELLARKYSKDLLYLSYMDSKEYASVHNENYYESSDEEDDFNDEDDEDDEDESDSGDEMDSDE